MSESSAHRDNQWSTLLTRCHGKDIEARLEFKAGLLNELKRKHAERSRPDSATTMDDDAKWRSLLQAAYVPCYPAVAFKESLLDGLKAKMAGTGGTAAAAAPAAETQEDKVLRTILTKSYQPVQPRREFETRLLVNLKERQRFTNETRIIHRRRSVFFSTVSSIAAAAMVVFVVWLYPADTVGVATAAAPEIEHASGDLRLPVPETSTVTAVASAEPLRPAQGFVLASTDASDAGVTAAAHSSDAGPAFVTAPAAFTHYKAADAFAGVPLPASAIALRNIEMNRNDGWTPLADATRMPLAPGDMFRANGGLGHLEFAGGSLVSLSPGAVLQATADGLTLRQGFMLAVVPPGGTERLRLHFPERDIAVEPGTDVAVLAYNPDDFAAGGAPAPMVMVTDGAGGPGGLALARGKNGIGPLFARQLYRLDKYVTPDLPGRTLCDTECNDLEKLFKMEEIHEDGLPLAAFASTGFTPESRDLGKHAMVLTPAGFTKKDSRWVADTYAGEETVKLPYLSDAYFAFVNQRRDLARELALGGEVILDGGDSVFYEIVR